MSWRIYRVQRQGKPCAPKRLAVGVRGSTAEEALAAFHAEFPWYPLEELKASQLALVGESGPVRRVL